MLNVIVDVQVVINQEIQITIIVKHVPLDITSFITKKVNVSYHQKNQMILI